MLTLIRRLTVVVIIFAICFSTLSLYAQEATPEATETSSDMGMEMDSGYSVDDLAPMAMAEVRPGFWTPG